jgi:hypothetical protein
MTQNETPPGQLDFRQIVQQVFASLGLDPAELARAVERVCGTPEYYYPVRHHSPNSAWHLQEYIRKQRPKVVFIEGPQDCDSLVPFLVDKGTKPPVAFFTFFRDDANSYGLNGVLTEDSSVPFRFMQWGPFVEFSPEYAAIKACAKAKIPVHFIDLPLTAMIPYSFRAELEMAKRADEHERDSGEDAAPVAARIASEDEGSDAAEEAGESSEETGDAGEGGEGSDGGGEIASDDSNLDQSNKKPGERGTTKQEKPAEEEIRATFEGNLEQRAILSSEFYKRLCDIFGFRTFDEVWESFLEIGSQNRDLTYYRESLLYFAAAIRATLSPEYLAADGTLAREQFMKYQIESQCAELGVALEDVLVVTGAMHSVALPATVPAVPEYSTEGLFSSIVPYSYNLISTAVGYQSGVPYPAYLNQVWQGMCNGVPRPYSAAASDFVVDAIREARNRDEVLSMADSIDSVHSAELLAAMRYRSEPISRDVVDAIEACCVKGNPNVEGRFLQQIVSDLFIGFRVGKVTDKLGNLPLQDDFYQLADLLTIPISAERTSMDANLRSEEGNARSKFLWRTNFMELQFADCVDGPLVRDDVRKFTEVWSVHWNTNIDAKLIELNSYGSTVNEACQNLLLEKIFRERKNAEKVTQLIYNAVVMDLTPKHFQKLYRTCMDALDVDSDLTHLARALNKLVLIRRQFLAQRLQPAELALLDRLVSRVYHTFCHAISNANPKEEDEQAFVVALQTVLGIVAGISGTEMDPTVFTAGLQTLLPATGNHFVKGACTGVLYLLGTSTLPEVANSIHEYLLSVDTIKTQVGEFVRGLFQACEAKLLFEGDILDVLNTVVRDITWDQFVTVLPSLRKTFVGLNKFEKDILLEKVAQRLGLEQVRDIKTLDAATDLVKLLVQEADKEVDEILRKWDGK